MPPPPLVRIPDLLVKLSTDTDIIAFVCVDKQVLSTTYIGANKEVKAETLSCANSLVSRDTLVKRQTDVCGNTCESL